MSAPEFAALYQRLRELATQAEGILRTIPVGRFDESLPEGLTLDEQVRLTTRTSDHVDGQPRIEVRPIRRRERTHPPTGSVQIRKIEVELRVVRALPLDAIKDDDKRYDQHALATEDGELLARVIEWPGNLVATAAGALTGCRSLVSVSSDGIVKSGSKGAGHPQLLETIHVFRGWMALDTLGGIGAPANTLAPSINVDGGGEAIEGAELVGTPGAWTDAVHVTDQWLRNGVAIAGETTLRHAIVAADLGASLELRENASGPGGTASADSNAIVPGSPIVEPLPEGFPFDPDPAVSPRHLFIGGYRVFSPVASDVASWGDVVAGGAVHRATAARSPLEVVGSGNLNGHPAVQFRAASLGVDSALRETDQSSHLFVQQPSAPGATIFIAWFKSQATSDGLLDTNNLNTSRSGFNLFHTLPTGTLTLRIGRDLPTQSALVSFQSAGGSVPAGAHYAVVRLLTGGAFEWELRVDAASLGSGVFSVAPGTDVVALGGLTLGGRALATTNGLTGEVGCFGFFDRRITDLELADLETWLARYLP